MRAHAKTGISNDSRVWWCVHAGASSHTPPTPPPPQNQHPSLRWAVGDARDLTTLGGGLGDTGRYEVVVDKGLLDALLSYRGDTQAGIKATREAARVLATGGRLVRERVCVCLGA